MRQEKSRVFFFEKFWIGEFKGWDYYYDGRLFHKQLRLDTGIRKEPINEHDMAFINTLDYQAIYNEKSRPITRGRPARSYDFELDFGRAGLGMRTKAYMGRR